MKIQLDTRKQDANQYRQLLLVALATVLMIGLGTRWVSAKSPINTGFTSPLAPQQPNRPADQRNDPLQGIIDRNELTAEVLGISVEELEAARQNGTPLNELIAQLGLDQESVKQELQNALGEAVEQAVVDGLLSEEQAEHLLNPPARPGAAGQPNRGDEEQQGNPGGNDPQPPVAGGGTIPPVVETANAEVAAVPPAEEQGVNNAAPAPEQPDRPRGERPGNPPAENAGTPTQDANPPAAENNDGGGGPQGNAGPNRRPGR